MAETAKMITEVPGYHAPHRRRPDLFVHGIPVFADWYWSPTAGPYLITKEARPPEYPDREQYIQCHPHDVPRLAFDQWMARLDQELREARCG